MEKSRGEGVIGNSLFAWRMLVCAVGVYFFYTGQAQDFLTSWFGESGHWVSMIKVGAVLLPLWFPDTFSGWILKLRMAAWYDKDEDPNMIKPSEEPLTPGKVIGELFASMLGLGIGIWVLWVFVWWLGSNWWIGQSIFTFLFLLFIFSKVPKWFAKGAPSIQDEKLQRVVARIFDKTTILLDRAFIKNKKEQLIAAAILPTQRCLLLNKFMLEIMDEDELEAVILHEAGHVKYHWVNRIQKTYWMFRLFVEFAVVAWVIHNFFGVELVRENVYVWGIFILLAKTLLVQVTKLPQMLLSRHEENLADEFSANHNGGGKSLASALRKLHDYLPIELKQRSMTIEVLKTHPELRRRYKRLMEMQA